LATGSGCTKPGSTAPTRRLKPTAQDPYTASPADVFLETDRLVLRQFTEADLDNLVELDSDPEVMHWVNGGRPTPRAALRDDLSWYIGYYERYPGFGFWAANEKSSGDFLGWFHFRPQPGVDVNLTEPELGYRLRKSAWGKGYGTEGARALIHRGFADPRVQRVVASTDAINIASRRVMEKCGMVLVRTFFGPRPDDPDGAVLEAVEYALERSAWEQAAAHEKRS
jgi:RimJ/RimL family protein N-acetyltransferase